MDESPVSGRRLFVGAFPRRGPPDRGRVSVAACSWARLFVGGAHTVSDVRDLKTMKSESYISKQSILEPIIYI